MLVKDLIAKLQTFDPSANVHIWYECQGPDYSELTGGDIVIAEKDITEINDLETRIILVAERIK